MKERKSYGANYMVCPAFVDVHVHFREPGYSYKETIRTGSVAAASAGYTLVATMPNLDPVPDTPEHLSVQEEIIRRDAVIDVIPYAAITMGRSGTEIVDIKALKSRVIAFSDDGSGVQSEDVMRRAMEKIAENDCILAAHCEDNSLLRGGYIHDGVYAARHGHRGICSESEWGQIVRDLRLAGETGCAYHVCHISTKESVDAIRRAKDRGVNVSCETAPHYLLLCDEDLQEDGRFKMNPPLRGRDDRQALVEGLKDGTIDMISTDHAPHSAEEKSRGLEHSAMGITGLETAFPLMYTHFVRSGIITLERLFDLMSHAPRRRFRLNPGDDGYCVYEISTPYIIESGAFRSMGRSTPFEGWEVYGRCVETVFKGKTIYHL